jgi:surface antigen
MFMRWSGTSYNGDGRTRQSPPFVRAVAIGLTVVSLAGCSRLGMPFGGSDPDPQPTGAIRIAAKVTDNVDPSDWEAIRRAVATAPIDGSDAQGIDWNNPDTGSSGVITAYPAVAEKGGALCRTLATTVNDVRGVRRYRGEACQRTDGRWQLFKIAADDSKLS